MAKNKNNQNNNSKNKNNATDLKITSNAQEIPDNRPRKDGPGGE